MIKIGPSGFSHDDRLVTVYHAGLPARQQGNRADGVSAKLKQELGRGSYETRWAEGLEAPRCEISAL